jgi:lysophospholipase L1-like esterase
MIKALSCHFFHLSKTACLIIATLIILAAYLYLANAYIYWRIGRGHLSDVETSTTYMLDPNSNLASSTAATTVYVSLGDSLTAGVGADNYQDSYPYLVAQQLEQTGDKVVLKNLSTPGITSAQLITNHLNQAIADKPNIVTILIGTNDLHNWVSNQTFKANYNLILKRLSQETTAKIYVISVPFIGSDTILLPPYDSYFTIKTKAYNNLIKQLAAKYQARYIDIATPTKSLFAGDGVQYSADSFHPSTYGYKIWSNIIYDSLNH